MGLSNLFKILFGPGRNLVRETVEVFQPNAENQAVRETDSYQAALKQFAAEFGSNRTWLDSVVDGLNRLPRPLFAFGTIALFTAAMTDPIWFAARMEGLALVPEPLWVILGAIITFFFGARELNKGRVLRTVSTSPQIVRKSVEAIREIEAIDNDADDAVMLGAAAGPDIEEGDNPVIASWK